MVSNFRLLLVLVLLLSASVSFAGWKEDYRNALKRERFTDAVRIVQREAEQGDVEAQNNLGLLYINGQGVNKDEVEGLSLLMVAAINGSKSAAQNSEFMKTRMKQEHIDKASEIARNHRWKRGR